MSVFGERRPASSLGGGSSSFCAEMRRPDSQLDDRSSSSRQSESLLEKELLHRKSWQLCEELRTVVGLTDAFRNDVRSEQSSCRELLAELQTKIRPFLIRLDEEIGVQEDLIRKNLDLCRIQDRRVDWLLRYNRFMIEFRRLIERLNVDVYDQLEQQLLLKVRGCHGSAPKVDLGRRLAEIFGLLRQLADAVLAEGSRSDVVRSPSFSIA